MNQVHKILPVWALLGGVAAAALSACGGGGGSGLVKTSGVAMDGYLENATVCLDKNQNGACDADEPTDTSRAGGEFTLSASADDLAKYPVLVLAKAGVTKDSDDGGATLDKDYVLSAPAGKTAVVSPLTTLVHAKVKAGASLDAAQTAVRADLGLTNDDNLFQDVVAAPKLHALARAVTEHALKAGETALTEPLKATIQTTQAQYRSVFEAEKAAQTAAATARAATQNGKKWVSIDFAAFAGNNRVHCGSSLAGLGTTQATGALQDLRFYISNVKLVQRDGSTVALTLGPNDDFNATVGDNRVSLIDLEDKSGACSGGTVAMNTAVQGTVPAGEYVGLQMTLGVRLALNHTNQGADVSVTPAVINNAVHPGMAWSWAGGRKFTKIEVTNPAWTAPSFFVHLGSTGCTGTNPANGQVDSCARPNRADVGFAAFDPDTQKIAVDVKALLSANDVTLNGAGPGGCMSGATDPECAAIFPALGLDLTAGTVVDQGQNQRLFRVVKK